MNLTYETEFALRAGDTDFTGGWRPASVFLAMQEAAEKHAEMIGVGFDKLRERDCAWVLARACAVIDKYPQMDDIVRLRTWPAKIRHMIFPRYFEFENQDGELIGSASTAWVIMKMSERRMVSDSSELGVAVPENFDRPAPLPMPGTVRRVEGVTLRSERRAVYSDIDVNGHVNNTRYIDWLCDCVSLEAHAKHRIKKITVNYNAEVLAGTNVELEFAANDGAFSFCGTSGGRNSFAICGELCPR
ncbi:MAG: thioesterase [Oscillospiraceae bacterium]